MNSLFFQYPLKRTQQKRVIMFPGWNEIDYNIQLFLKKKGNLMQEDKLQMKVCQYLISNKELTVPQCKR